MQARMTVFDGALQKEAHVWSHLPPSSRLGLTPQAPGIVLTKSASHRPSDEVNNYAALGETVEFEIIGKNAGNVDLTGAVAEDPMFDGKICCATLRKVCEQYYFAGRERRTLDSGPLPGRFRSRAVTVKAVDASFMPNFRVPSSVHICAIDNGLCVRLAAETFDAHCASGVPDPWEVDAEFACTPTYAITQEDIDAGIVTNIAR